MFVINPKIINKLLPTFIRDAIVNKLLSYQNFLFDKMGKCPELFDKKGNFIGGHLTTNAIEGGNWHIKYTLKTLYSNLESVFGRTVTIINKKFNVYI